MIKQKVQYSSRLTGQEIKEEVNQWLTTEKGKVFKIEISWPTSFRNPKFKGNWINEQEFEIRRNTFPTINYQNPVKPIFQGEVFEQKDKTTRINLIYRLSNTGLLVLVFFLSFLLFVSILHQETTMVETFITTSFVSGIIYSFYLIELNMARSFIVDRLKLTKLQYQ